MGVDYKAILIVGKRFDEIGEVVDFLNGHNVLTEEEKQEIEECGDGIILDMFYGSGDELLCECLNAYSGDDYVLGYNLDVRDAAAFAVNTQLSIAKWESWFGTEPDVIHAVKIY